MATGIATISLALAIAGRPASAQVLEVGADGSLATYAGPVQTIDGVVRPIARAPARSVRHASLVARPGLAAAKSIEMPPGVPRLIEGASERSQLSAQLIEAVAWQESRMNQAAVSPRGARGVMQLMPATAARLGVDAGDLRDNLDGGAAYLSSLLREFNGDIILSLAAYDAGPEAVRRWGGVPPFPETRAYVAAVLDRLSQLASEPSPTSR